MDNIILTGMLKDFVTRHELEEDTLDRQFEKFANYCLLKTDYYDSFEFEKVGTGECIGVDGVAVVIGGVIVNELDDASQFTKGQFEAKFVFSQAKTSAKFDLGDFLKFTSTVKVFFGTDEAAIPKELIKAFSIKKLIYERASKLRQLPTIEIAYVYSGKFDLEKSRIAPNIEGEVAALKAMPYLFSDVVWYVHDGDSIARLYRETQNDIQKEISFQRHVALPPITGARAAYLGVVKCEDYVKLIQKENGELNKGLFFENVRDFLGDINPVNEDIAQTIRNPDERDRFAVLNNGVTIVSKTVTPSGDTFKLSQFQVVNGCQTSHVLFNNRSRLGTEMFMTVKLIETSDVDLSGKIIATTNSQSQVTKEAFATIKPYHRGLEDFFNAMRGTGFPYYYERRPHQYDHQDDIKQHFIVSAPLLIKSFVSVVLEEPHKVHYYYGRLLSEYNRNQASELFSDDDYPGLYFAAHHIASKTRNSLSKKRHLNEWAYHLALMIKKKIAPELSKGKALTDKKFLEVLNRIDDQFDEAYKDAVKVLEALKLQENQNRVPNVTDQIIRQQNEHAHRPIIKQAAATGKTNPEVAPALGDGLYIGVIQNLDVDRGIATLRYGPYAVDVKFHSEITPKIKFGERVSFAMKGHKGTIQLDQS